MSRVGVPMCVVVWVFVCMCVGVCVYVGLGGSVECMWVGVCVYVGGSLCAPYAALFYAFPGISGIIF